MAERISAHGAKGPVLVLAGVVGAAGFACSVVLALGALLIALEADGSGFYRVVADACDVLAGPLRGLVDFSGRNAATKDALTAWGLGSILYLVVGMSAQSYLRSRAGD